MEGMNIQLVVKCISFISRHCQKVRDAAEEIHDIFDTLTSQLETLLCSGQKDKCLMNASAPKDHPDKI